MVDLRLKSKEQKSFSRKLQIFRKQQKTMFHCLKLKSEKFTYIENAFIENFQIYGNNIIIKMYVGLKVILKVTILHFMVSFKIHLKY